VREGVTGEPDDGLIKPHGGKLVCRLVEDARELAEAKKRAEGMKKRVTVSNRENGDLIMMGIGGFSPLTGFMGQADWSSVCDNMLTADGTFWPIPITLSVGSSLASTLRRGDDVSLWHGSPTPSLVGTLRVSDVWPMRDADRLRECESVFRTADPEHPGVKMVHDQLAVNVGGEVRVFSEGGYPERYPGVYMRPAESRRRFAERGWKTVAALQLRNPMHRSHEYLAKIAAEVMDGVFIHSLVGNLKPGDIPAHVRVRCIDALVKNYFYAPNVIQGGYPLDMRYAGPREALLHALFRQNYGCTHMIVGRDHAGVGSYYGLFDAQKIFDTIPVPSDPAKALLCKPLKIDWTFYCLKCDGPASLRTCPHEKADRVVVSGTMVRKLLSEGGELPDHFGRPEVIEILREYYSTLSEKDKVPIKLGHAATM
jgi:sulfate adenylyltransferase